MWNIAMQNLHSLREIIEIPSWELNKKMFAKFGKTVSNISCKNRVSGKKRYPPSLN